MNPDEPKDLSDEAFAASMSDLPDLNAPAAEAPQVDPVQQLKNEVAEMRDRALRAQAELDNVRKRLYREMDEERRYANLPLLGDLLPVVDNIGRAIEAAQKATEASAIVEGFKLVQSQFESVLAKHNCKKIAALNEPFDPHRHMAIMQQPSADVAPNTVVLVAQEGYQVHERVVRPAQVIVAKAVE